MKFSFVAPFFGVVHLEPDGFLLGRMPRSVKPILSLRPFRGRTDCGANRTPYSPSGAVADRLGQFDFPCPPGRPRFAVESHA
jgi:hypothetical protein